MDASEASMCSIDKVSSQHIGNKLDLVIWRPTNIETCYMEIISILSIVLMVP